MTDGEELATRCSEFAVSVLHGTEGAWEAEVECPWNSDEVFVIRSESDETGFAPTERVDTWRSIHCVVADNDHETL